MAELRQGRKSGVRKGPARRRRGRPSVSDVAEIDRLILDVALDLFLRHGFGLTSMAMIINAAGISKTTLYARYPTKPDLFRAIVQRTVEQVGNITPEVGETVNLDLVDGLIAFGTSAIRIGWTGVWPFYERLVYGEGPRFPELATPIDDRINSAIVTVSRFIGECAERDGVRCTDPEAVARSYVMALRGYYLETLLSVREPGEEEILDFVAALVRTLVGGRAAW